MLGTRRQSPLDHLESERAHHTKIPKGDALSIYEATLEKLRHGSRRAFEPHSESMKCEALPALDARPDCGSPSTDSGKQVEKITVSVLKSHGH